MPLVIAFQDAKATQFRRQGLITPFLKSSGDTLTLFPKSSGDTPDLVAWLAQGAPDAVTQTHFHTVDQFQVIAEGKGKFGRHDVAPYWVHFSRAYTPYGPIVGDSKTGISLLILRAHADPGAQYLPKSLDKLKQVPDRRPWQITRQIKFPPVGGSAVSGAIKLQEVPDMRDDQGLFAHSLTMAPNAKTTTPDPSRGDGQYLIVVKGSLWHENKEHKAFTIVFIAPKDEPFQTHAGAEGLEAIIMNLPQVKPRPVEAKTPSTAAGFKKWQCALCSFAYDEALGMPEEGVEAGTRWKDVPDRWSCPDCSASKSDFQMVEM